MGSLVALLSRSGPPDDERVRKMVAAAPHRGERAKLVTAGNVIVGVGAGDGVGAVDVASDGELAAAFAGDFDNLEDMARESDRATEGAAPASPARVLLNAFRVHGPRVPIRIRGPFSGVVTDGRALWSFRDAVGFRPLVFRDDGRHVFVATEVKQIVAGSGISYEPDLDVLEKIFYSQYGDDLRCAVRGVEHIAQGGTLTSDDRGSHWARYWDPRDYLETARYSAADLQDQFDELMFQAAARSLRGGDAVSLSGGVDSPAVAAYAAPIHLKRTGRRLPAMSAFYPDFPTVDESDYVRIVARELDLELHSYEPRAGATDGLLDWVRLFDGPVPVVSLAQTHESLIRARQAGFRCLLTGEMAEFVFDVSRGVLDYLLARGRIPSALRYASRRDNGQAHPVRLTRRAVKALLPGRILARRAGAPRRVPEWVDPKKLVRSAPLPGWKKWREDQVVTLRGSTLSLIADDFIQSIAGVSTRRPWTDLDVWQFFLSLPAQVKHPTPQKKALVRTLLRGRVPDVILDRRDKTVFDAAIAAGIDYELLESWLVRPSFRMDGVRYDVLEDRLRQRKLNLVEYMYAKDLAAVHAFVSVC